MRCSERPSVLSDLARPYGASCGDIPPFQGSPGHRFPQHLGHPLGPPLQGGEPVRPVLKDRSSLIGNSLQNDEPPVGAEFGFVLVRVRSHGPDSNGANSSPHGPWQSSSAPGHKTSCVRRSRAQSTCKNWKNGGMASSDPSDASPAPRGVPSDLTQSSDSVSHLRRYVSLRGPNARMWMTAAYFSAVLTLGFFAVVGSLLWEVFVS